MILPPDDSVVVPPTNDGELVTDSTNPPAPSLADTQALLPGWARKMPPAVRDAWLAAWGKVANTVWARTSFTLEAQQSPRFAEGTWLDWHGQRRTMPRVAGESDADYRARLLTFNDVVSPNAIKALVAARVAKYTPMPYVHVEPATDAMFLGSPTSPWQAFVQSSARRLWASYPDRPAGWVGGAYVVEAIGGKGGTAPKPGAGRFWIVLPTDGGDYGSVPCLQTTTSMPSTADCIDQVGSTTYVANRLGFLVAGGTTLIEAVAQAVESARGAVQWLGFVDQYISTAL